MRGAGGFLLAYNAVRETYKVEPNIKAGDFDVSSVYRIICGAVFLHY